MNIISSLLENFKMAIDSIISNKMRSFLTMLGIIIGISSVIAIISLGAGGQESITGEFEKLGSSTVNVSTDTTKASESDMITFEDIKQIRNKVDTAKYVAPSVSKTGVAISDTSNKRASISGTNTDGFIIQNTEFLYGRAFNEREYTEGKNVVIIDEDSANDLFGYTDVTGKSIKIGSAKSPIKATIIGVTVSPFGSTFKNMGRNQRPGIFYVPATLLQNMYSNEFSIDKISIMASDKDTLEETGNSAKNVLESRHNNRGKDIYTAQGALSQLDQINNVLGIFTTFIGAVAAISLIVGGIGVMNIMLVSVTERTREIGIRKAIGATTNKILLQFLTESVIISLIGGIIGLLVGIIGAYGIGSFASITPSLSISAIIGVIAFSSAVGIFFGIYPARKAAKLDPIEALRYE
ncbi:ABC transporter permease [Clostridium folliculivorans]|uniref:Macrolide ABC transporter permease n=1 Tax=Clostridium folliculivorans TaxID=2886038 RepID=A0A9W5Y180_9CLOT|nr:ABC transporter permease [Clostridium folliculivorans]GKU24679.1 macrolide ABC transporter permease [Clostridium folliculivorans]GKU30777.1 macrolide ABC transporter permease [Clostridium folliculivorans]